jgi:hypothetical protein
VSKSLPSHKKEEFLGDDESYFHDKRVLIQTNAAEGEWLVQMLLKLPFQILKPIIFKKSKVIFETILKILNYYGTQNTSIP